MPTPKIRELELVEPESTVAGLSEDTLKKAPVRQAVKTIPGLSETNKQRKYQDVEGQISVAAEVLDGFSASIESLVNALELAEQARNISRNGQGNYRDL